MKYQIRNEYFAGKLTGQSFIRTNDDETVTSFGTNPANTDYQKFKADVLAGAELQDADGNVMTQEEADSFIATLP